MFRLLTILMILTGGAKAQIDTVSVYFDTDVHVLTGAALAKLQRVLDSFDNTEALIVVGYADERGTAVYNRKLSERRAKSVSDFFQQNSVSRERMRSVQGKGEIPRNNEVGMYPSDRRVDIVIISEHEGNDITETGMPELVEKVKELKKGQSVVLRNMYFFLGVDIPTPSSKPTMEDLLKTMRANPDLRIRLEGHVCCNDSSNMRQIEGGYVLSRLRAELVANYLVDSGIDKRRIETKGYGMERALFPQEKYESDRQANRRVEVRILDGDQ